ncbi:uncharacterized protein LOC143509970 isoform X1 [Brachyhypopomus gauderio]|uniref:uncharacterized protein LOC143509970 isoform X1 n=1 Tax=Brachyhypopomus gauderio TaxID=698409 RepID=UPI004041C830
MFCFWRPYKRRWTLSLFHTAEFAKMPQVPCVSCNSTMPLQMLALHAEECQQTTNDQTGTVIVEDREVLETSEELVENATETELPKSSHGICPICQKEFPMSVLPYHGSVCAESSFTVSISDMERPGPSSLSEAPSPEVDLWKTVEDQKETVRLFLEQLRRQGQSQPFLLLMLDSRDNDEERDRSLISFYKESHQKSRWAAPFRCHIQGDAAISSGVTRHILSSAITKLKHGFKLNFGLYIFNTIVYILYSGIHVL